MKHIKMLRLIISLRILVLFTTCPEAKFDAVMSTYTRLLTSNHLLFTYKMLMSDPITLNFIYMPFFLASQEPSTIIVLLKTAGLWCPPQMVCSWKAHTKRFMNIGVP